MMIKEKNFISAVVYVHNVENRIEKFMSMLIDILENNFEHSEIICVNDCSDDKSMECVEHISRKAVSTSISVINMSYYHGLELSMNAGVDMSIGDFVYEFDNVNIDYDASMIMTVYKHSLEGYDIVSASPDKKEKYSSRMFYRIFAHYSGTRYRMSTESFRILSRRVINRINSMNTKVLYRKAVYANCGLMTDNVKYQIKENKISSIDKKERHYRTDLAIDSLILFTDMGYSFSKTMTMVMMIVSLFMIIYSIVVYITANPVAGWTTTILFFSFAFFGLFGILTIVIKYLQLIVDLVFRKKHYTFRNVEKLTK